MANVPPRTSCMPAKRPAVRVGLAAVSKAKVVIPDLAPVMGEAAGSRYRPELRDRGAGESMPKILAIEDDATTGKEIVAELEQHGFEVDWSADGAEGLERALSGGYAAVILDRLLPNVDGLAIVTALRGAGLEIPVLMISALSDVDERIRGLRAGGDDYMTKPFASEEMAARLEVLLRR